MSKIVHIGVFDNIPVNCHLVNLDVCSVYTNIPVLQSKEAVMASLALNRPQIGVKPSNKPLLKPFDLVLTKNNFQFNGHNYIQTTGVSMGSRVSPSLAILYMGDFEEKYVHTYHLQPLIFFVRYIDDIFMIWPHYIL